MGSPPPASRRPARTSSCWTIVLMSPHLRRIVLENVSVERNAEARRLAEHELAVEHLRLLDEEPAPERVAHRVGEDLLDVAVRDRREQMAVDLRIVVRRHQDAVR